MFAATLPRTGAFDIERPDGLTHRLFVGWPEAPPPAGGYPVVYVLDGNAYFHEAVQTSRVLTYRPDMTKLDAAIIVGVGYPIDDAYDQRRRSFDYTPPVDPQRLTLRPNDEPWPPTGGADAFIDFLETVVKPRITSQWPIDPARAILFGHSFGGLFALYTALTRPALYRNFLASSPSIWFGGGAVLDHEVNFAERLRTVQARRDLMISVGEDEQTPPRDHSFRGAERWIAWLKQNRIVDNAEALVRRLATVEGLDLTHLVFAGENHITAPPFALSRGLRIALRQKAEISSKAAAHV